MIAMLLCSVILLLVMGWVLRINSIDRKIFERELVEDLADDSGSDMSTF